MKYYANFANKIVMPESIMPEQFFDASRQQQGGRKLLYAIFENAWSDLIKYNKRTETWAARLFREAKAWFLADDYNWMCSAVNVCLALDYPLDRIRRIILEDLPTREPGKSGYCNPYSYATRKQRRGWTMSMQDGQRMACLRIGKAIYHLKSFPLDYQAKDYLVWARKHIQEAIRGKEPAEYLSTISPKQHVA